MEIRHRRLKELLSYWEEKRAGRPHPRRADIDPLDIPDILPLLLMVDTLMGKQNYRIRVMGTKAVEVFERDYTGKNIVDMDFDGSDEQVMAAIRDVTGEDRPVRLDLEMVNRDNMIIRYEMLLLPLSRDSDKPDLVLVGFGFGEPIRQEE
jgi:hypothetical protein